MGCQKLTYYESKTTLGENWKIFASGIEKTASSSIFCKDYYAGGSIMPGRSFNSSEYRYGFNKGSEKDDEITGVTGSHITTFYREGDTRLLKWWSVDPKADLQPWQSPYNYMDGNPVVNNDPDGDCPWCWGAIIGAAVEYGSQVAVNVAKGQNFTEAAWDNVDFSDVGVATLEGALTGGVSSVRRLAVKTAVVVTAEVVKASVDIHGNGKVDIVGTATSNKTATSVVTEAVVGSIVSGTTSVASSSLAKRSSNQAVKSAQSNVVATAKNLSKSNTVVSNSNTRTKAALPNQAFNQFNAAKQNLSITKALNETQKLTQTGVGVVGNLTGKGAQQAVKEATGQGNGASQQRRSPVFKDPSGL
jgi:K+/H+ antiporter YhaU regulatory subunit KhtT